MRKEEFEEIDEIPAYDREALSKSRSNIKPADAKTKKEPKQTKDAPQ